MEVVLRFPTSDRLGPPGPYPPGEGGGGYHIKYTVGLTVTAESEGYELSFIVKNIRRFVPFTHCSLNHMLNFSVSYSQ